MAEPENEQERPCLHRMMVELIDDFFAEYPPAPGRSDKVGTEEADEVIEAIGYQLAGSLLRPRRTNVCRQSGCSMSSMRRLGKRRSSVLIAISPSRRASCAPTQ